MFDQLSDLIVFFLAHKVIGKIIIKDFVLLVIGMVSAGKGTKLRCYAFHVIDHKITSPFSQNIKKSRRVLLPPEGGSGTGGIRCVQSRCLSAACAFVTTQTAMHAHGHSRTDGTADNRSGKKIQAVQGACSKLHDFIPLLINRRTWGWTDSVHRYPGAGRR